MRSRICALLIGLIAATVPTATSAHAIGQRFTIPIPLALYLYGAAAAVALSFIVIGLFVGRDHKPETYPRVDLLRQSWFSSTLGQPIVLNAIRTISVAVFALTLASALVGVQDPDGQFAPTFVWVVFWVGLTFFVAFIGNIWPLINPWKILFIWADNLAGSLGLSSGLEMRLPYPRRLGVLPAATLLFIFLWIENVFIARAYPSTLATLIIVYSLLTWIGMALFGMDVWLRNGEFVSVLFRILGRFAPIEMRVTDGTVCDEHCVECRRASVDGSCVDCESCFEWAPAATRALNLRPWAAGLTLPEPLPVGMLSFILIMLAGVTFDGVQATTPWQSLFDHLFNSQGSLDMTRYYVVFTGGLLGIILLFHMAFYTFCLLIRLLTRSSLSVHQIALRFIPSIVPIALAYEFAHYYTLLAIQGQLMVGLISNPFGWGWNIFGTADYSINGHIFSAGFVWYSMVIAIVAGHVIAVYLAHVIALRAFPRRAVRSQYPMLALMVLYTMTSLWIISQPVVKEAGAAVASLAIG